jgi:hypothetical protein
MICHKFRCVRVLAAEIATPHGSAAGPADGSIRFAALAYDVHPDADSCVSESGFMSNPNLPLMPSLQMYFCRFTDPGERGSALLSFISF